MKRTFFLVTLMMLLLLPAMGWAADWYVRPAGGDYGNEDGTSYENAFDGFSNVSGLSSGDTLWVCGTHRETLTINWSNAIVRLDYPSDPGVICGSDRIDGDDSGWSGPDANGEYSISLSTECNVVIKDGIVMLKGTVGSLSPNEWDWDSNTLYIGSDPSGHTFEVGQRNFLIQFPDSAVSNFTIIGDGEHKQLCYANRNAISASWDGNTQSYGDLTVENIWFDANASQCIHSDGSYTFDTVIVRNCKITQNGGEGIYLKNNINTKAIIENNIIGSGTYDNFGWNGGGTAYDGDGIDLGHGYEITIRNNIIQNINGTGILAQSGDALIEDNTIIEPGIDRTTKCGIYIDPQESTDEVIVRRNRILMNSSNADGIQARAVSGNEIRKEISYNLVVLPMSSAKACVTNPVYNTRYFKILNNTLIGGTHGVYMDGENPISCEIKNNIIKNSTHNLYFTQSGLSGIQVTHNAFYPVGSSNDFYVAGTTYTTLSAFESAISTALNNMDDDPRLLSTYHLSHNSPCINAGTTISGFYETALDLDKQPIIGTPDIGCDERKALWWDGRRWHMQKLMVEYKPHNSNVQDEGTNDILDESGSNILDES